MPLLMSTSQGLNNHLTFCRYLCSPIKKHSRAWTYQKLRPYIVYLKEKQVQDAFFGGLIFEADRVPNGEVLSAKAIGFGEPAAMNSWQLAIDELFKKEQNLSAALQASSERPAAQKLDIWIALPYPIETRQIFGMLQGRLLDFQEYPEHREAALKWWVDEVLNQWNLLEREIPDHQARLCGFVWTKNSLGTNDETLLMRISEHIHSHELKIMWIQNYGTVKGWDGEKLGIDLVFVRPTFTGSDPRGAAWFKSAVKFANQHKLGIAIWNEFNESAKYFSELLELGTKNFKNAFQVHEFGGRTIYRYFKNRDPKYDLLYKYMNSRV